MNNSTGAPAERDNGLLLDLTCQEVPARALQPFLGSLSRWQTRPVDPHCPKVFPLAPYDHKRSWPKARVLGEAVR